MSSYDVCISNSYLGAVIVANVTPATCYSLIWSTLSLKIVPRAQTRVHSLMFRGADTSHTHVAAIGWSDKLLTVIHVEVVFRVAKNDH